MKIQGQNRRHWESRYRARVLRKLSLGKVIGKTPVQNAVVKAGCKTSNGARKGCSVAARKHHQMMAFFVSLFHKVANFDRKRSSFTLAAVDIGMATSPKGFSVSNSHALMLAKLVDARCGSRGRPHCCIVAVGLKAPHALLYAGNFQFRRRERRFGWCLDDLREWCCCGK